MHESKAYTPPASVVPFFLADAFADFIVGPVGSTKTTAGLVKILYEAKRVAPCRDGIRRSRCAVIRNTCQMLNDATIPDFLKWFPEGVFGSLLRTEKKFILRVDDVECEVLFRGLDGPDDVRRLLSVQLTFALMDEFREINADVFNALTGRLGRYPDKSMNGVGAKDDQGVAIHKVWGMSNPPDMDTFWETYLTHPPSNAHVTIQPSGLSPSADWVQYLPDGYYENLMLGKDEDWIDVYVHGKFGSSLSGRPVYDKTFDYDTHVAKTALIPFVSTSHPIVVGLDFGRTPAACIGQRNAFGQALIYDELTSVNMGLEMFLITELKPKLAARFPGYPVVIAGDPAGWAKSQLNEDSCADVLRKAGFKAVRPASNATDVRLRAVESLLLRNMAGKPGMLIDPRCKEIITGFRGGYRYKVKKDGMIETAPDKNKFSHCFPATTQVSTPSGLRSIEDIQPGDWVSTPIGPRRVTATMTRQVGELVRALFADDSGFMVTKDHPLYGEKGIVFSDALQYDTVLLREGETTCHAPSTQSLTTEACASTKSQTGTTKLTTGTAALTCTDTCGSRSGERSRMGSAFTTATTIVRTIKLRILSYFGCRNTRGTTPRNELQRVTQASNLGLPPETLLKSGMGLPPDANGTESTVSGLGTSSTPSSRRVHGAESYFLDTLPGVKRAIAECRARGQQGSPVALMTKHESAWYVEAVSGLIATGKLELAPKLVRIDSVAFQKPVDVYDLTVEEAHCFFATGILVSNCHDATQYYSMCIEGAISGSYATVVREEEKVDCGGWT